MVIIQETDDLFRVQFSKSEESFTKKDLTQLFYDLGTVLGHEIPFTCKKCKEQTNRINDEGLCFSCGVIRTFNETWKINDITINTEPFVPFSKNYQSNDVKIIPVNEYNSVLYENHSQFIGAVKGIANDFLNKKDTTSKQAIFRIIKQLNNYFPGWRKEDES